MISQNSPATNFIVAAAAGSQARSNHSSIVQVPRSAASLHQAAQQASLQHQSTGGTAKKDHASAFQSQSKPSATSQEKLRRNLSKEYCPMIIKSTNKNYSQGLPGQSAQ